MEKAHAPTADSNRDGEGDKDIAAKIGRQKHRNSSH
jgi:hypothetical protein